MKLKVYGKLFGNILITNENDEKLYESKYDHYNQKLISLKTGEEVVAFKKKLSTNHKYEIYLHGQLACLLSKEFNIFKKSYYVDNGYKVVGNFFMFDFSVFDESKNQIAVIERNAVTKNLLYDINVLDDSKMDILLALMLVIHNEVRQTDSAI